MSEIIKHSKCNFNQPLRVVMAGHVDDGKSSLIGRLLYSTNSLEDGKYVQIISHCKKRGIKFEWSFITDSLQSEREQSITIGTSHYWLKAQEKKIQLIDIPGHKDYFHNAFSGASKADMAIIIVDVTKGVREQTRRHGMMLSFLGIKNIIVVINKMDLISYEEKAFNVAKEEILSYLKLINIVPISIIPISAYNGDNIIYTSNSMLWYTGLSLFEYMINQECSINSNINLLRLPIQDIYNFNKRVIVGRIESGILQVGEKILFSPLGKIATVKEIIIDNTSVPTATMGMCVALTIDKALVLHRGIMISHAVSSPRITTSFKCALFGVVDKKIKEKDSITLKINHQVVLGTIQKISNSIDFENNHFSNYVINPYGFGECIISTETNVSLDTYNNIETVGKFIVKNKNVATAAGIIISTDVTEEKTNANIYTVSHRVNRASREVFNKHGGGILWMTGLSCSGKSTLAMELENKLFKLGYQTYVLDGDNIRNGLNSDLNFSEMDRTENIRRLREVAKLFLDAGMVCITSFISPFKQDREIARYLIGNNFYEIYIKCSLKVCIERDDKGLYTRAKKGSITDFSGIHINYEEPTSPDLTIDTENYDYETCLSNLIKFVQDKIPLVSL